jgi:hypothetical protein
MKLILSSMLLLASVQAFAVPETCASKAEKAVRTDSEYSDRYENEEVIAFSCKLAPNGAVVLCEVAASKGGGDASDEYRVVMNKTCSKVLHIDLIGEE